MKEGKCENKAQLGDCLWASFAVETFAPPPQGSLTADFAQVLA